MIWMQGSLDYKSDTISYGISVIRWDPKDPLGSRRSRGIRWAPKIRWDPVDPVGSRGSGGIQRIRWDPEDPMGSRGSGGTQRIRWDPVGFRGSRGSGGIQRIQGSWDPEDPNGSGGIHTPPLQIKNIEDPEDHGIHRIRWDPMGPVGSIPPPPPNKKILRIQ